MTETAGPGGQQIVVVGPDGQPMGLVPGGGTAGGADSAVDIDGGDDSSGVIAQPAKVMRIGSMIKTLLEEVKAAPLDEASRNRLRAIHDTSISELADGLSPDLREELERLTLPFADDGSAPSDAELRIAQAQLVGWLEGLFHGIQTALFAQQMAARVQFEEMRRRALPGGSPGMPGVPGMGPAAPDGSRSGTGNYL